MFTAPTTVYILNRLDFCMLSDCVYCLHLTTPFTLCATLYHTTLHAATRRPSCPPRAALHARHTPPFMPSTRHPSRPPRAALHAAMRRPSHRHAPPFQIAGAQTGFLLGTPFLSLQSYKLHPHQLTNNNTTNVCIMFCIYPSAQQHNNNQHPIP